MLILDGEMLRRGGYRKLWVLGGVEGWVKCYSWIMWRLSRGWRAKVGVFILFDVRCSIEAWAGRHPRWQRQWNVDNDNNLALRVVSQHRVMACLSLRRSPVNPPLFDCRMKRASLTPAYLPWPVIVIESKNPQTHPEASNANNGPRAERQLTGIGQGGWIY